MPTAAYLYLCAAIVLDVAGTMCMKYSAGFTRPLPSVLLFVFYAACFTVFTFALKQLDVGVCYAMWSGLGSSLVAILGVVVFHEHMTWAKALSLVLIIVGVVSLRFSES